MEKVIYININNLREHPKQEEIYGKTTVDDDFVNSIADRGVLQPLLVVLSSRLSNMDGDEVYTIIAGHRRRLGAHNAGLNEVPCVVKKYDDFETESVIDLVFSNKTREKTKEQKARQISALQQILCQASQLRIKYKSFAADKIENGNLLPIGNRFENNAEIVAFFEGKEIKTSKIIAKQTGMNENEVNKYVAVCTDEYIYKFRDKIEKESPESLPAKFTNQIIFDWEANRQEFYNEKISLDKAYNNVLELKHKVIEMIDKKKNGGKKPEKEKKEKAPSSIKKFTCPRCGHESIYTESLNN